MYVPKQYGEGFVLLSKYFNLKIIALLVVILGISSCSAGDDVAAILKLVNQGELLAENKDLGGLMKLGNDSFVAMPGELDKRGTKGILWRAFMYYGQFDILYPRPLIIIEEDDTAFVSFPFLVIRKGELLEGLQELYDDPGQWLKEVGNKADLYNLDLELVREDRAWKVRQATLGGRP